MTPEEQIDSNLDAVLKTFGSELQNYQICLVIEPMRKVMRKIMRESYINGSNACWESIKNKRTL